MYCQVFFDFLLIIICFTLSFCCFYQFIILKILIMIDYFFFLTHQMTPNENVVPRDAKIISLILRSLGIEECEPKVLLQMLEFAYKYVTDVLLDAQSYSEHCGRTNISLQDTKLALQTRIGKHFVTPPPRQYMNDIASVVNSKPLLEYENENMLMIPDPKRALLGMEYDIVGKEVEKKRK